MYLGYILQNIRIYYIREEYGRQGIFEKSEKIRVRLESFT